MTNLLNWGTKVQDGDVVKVRGVVVAQRKAHTLFNYNKPIGITCTTDLRVEGNIIDAISYHKRIFPIGRLDKPSQGLILLTDDGDIVNKILRARNHHEKEYIVSVNKDITNKFYKKCDRGTHFGYCDASTVTKINKNVFKIILTQGLNRQIRRMCQYLSYKVTSLKRVRIMNIHLDIPVGKYRELRPAELKKLQKLLVDSEKRMIDLRPRVSVSIRVVRKRPVTPVLLLFAYEYCKFYPLRYAKLSQINDFVGISMPIRGIHHLHQWWNLVRAMNNSVGTSRNSGIHLRIKIPSGSCSLACFMGLYTRMLFIPVTPACICNWQIYPWFIIGKLTLYSQSLITCHQAIDCNKQRKQS